MHWLIAEIGAADLAVFIAKIGATALVVVAAVWGLVKFGGKKWIEHYFDKKKESHKAEQEQNRERYKAEQEQNRDSYKAERQHDLERYKAEQQENLTIRLAISERRLKPYQELWALMGPLSQRSSDKLDRSDLETKFRAWYYTSGNALFLSWKAMDAYVRATDLLSKKDDDQTDGAQDQSWVTSYLSYSNFGYSVDDKSVRDAFSALRTQMKKDMDVYTSDEAVAQVGGAQVGG